MAEEVKKAEEAKVEKAGEKRNRVADIIEFHQCLFQCQLQICQQEMLQLN